MMAATACGCDTYTAWLPFASTTVEPARFDIARCASGGIILSSVETRYQLGLVLHAGSVTAPLSASSPHGTWESAMKAAASGATSAANDARNFARSRKRYPSSGGMIGGTGAPGGGFLMSADTDSPLSGAKAAMYTRPATFGSLPASVITTPPYEWPTRIAGPVCRASVRFVTATSSASDVVGFWTTVTL